MPRGIRRHPSPGDLMSLSRGVLLIAAGLFALTASACRPDQQDRPLHFTQGQYQGQADEKLGDAQVKELQQRGNLMR